MNIKKIAEDSIEKLEQDTVGQIKTTAQATKTQVAPGTTQAQQSPSDTGTNEHGVSSNTNNNPQATNEVVKSFYESSQKSNDGKEPSEYFKSKVEGGMDSEEAAKLENLRKKLHKEQYYEPLVHRKTSAQEEQEKEQLEQEEEKKEEMVELEEQKKKDDDIAVQRSAQKTEKFPGGGG